MAEYEVELHQKSKHLKFCESLEVTSERGGLCTFLPLPPSIVYDFDNRALVGSSFLCTGCGFPFDATALDVFSMPCRHVYHMLCFAHACKEYGCCAAMNCQHLVPERAKAMMGEICKAMKIEHSIGKLDITSLIST